MQKFFVGIHRLAEASKFDCAFISAQRLWDTMPFLEVGGEWVMDSGAFTEIADHGRYRFSVEEYARLIRHYANEESRFASLNHGKRSLLAAVAQDFMCERNVCARVMGRISNIRDFDDKNPCITEDEYRAQILLHQQWTIERYDALMACDVGGVYIMPVLQGFLPEEYVRHIEMYGDRIKHGAWIGVGSVCKRQDDPKYMLAVLRAIKAKRPDLRLHGFGVKLAALKNPEIAELFHTADSMAWSFAARKRWGDSNSSHAAWAFEKSVLDAVGLSHGEKLAGRIARLASEGKTLDDAAREDGAKSAKSRAGLRAVKDACRRMEIERILGKITHYGIDPDEAQLMAPKIERITTKQFKTVDAALIMHLESLGALDRAQAVRQLAA